MYSVRRKQQMLKIRLMGTKSDIRWFQNFLQIDSDIEVLELSDIYPKNNTEKANKGTSSTNQSKVSYHGLEESSV